MKQSFYARTWAKLKSEIRRHGLLSPGDSVLVGVSGGPDSVCLLHFLSRLGQRLGLRLGIAHVHHGLRGKEADLDAAFVKKMGDSMGIPVSICRVDVSSHARMKRQSPEQAARELRYRAMKEIAVRKGYKKLAVGHHMDDQAETLLLNLLRGTEPQGLAGMPPSRPIGPRRTGPGSRIQLIRPLLGLTRSEIVKYLKFFGLRYRTDRSNLSERIARNWIRRKLIPILKTRNPQVRKNLALLAYKMRRLIPIQRA